MKSTKLFGLSPEEVEYLRKIRNIHGVYLSKTDNRVIVDDRKTEAECFFVELLILDELLS